MGNNLNISIGALGAAAVSAREAVEHEAGIRVNPQATLNFGGFAANAGFEAGVTKQGETPLGATSLDTYDDRFYTANLAYIFRSGSWIKLGRYNYERTDIENNLITNNTYNASGVFSNLAIPVGWVGAELRWQGQNPFRILSGHNLALDYMLSDKEDGQRQQLILAQGAINVNMGGSPKGEDLGPEAEASSHNSLQITLGGNYALRLNGVPDSGGPLIAGATDPNAEIPMDQISEEAELIPTEYAGRGLSHGGMGAIQLDWPKVSALVAVGGQRGEFEDGEGMQYGESRTAFTAALSVNLPEIFQGKVQPFLRGGYNFLNQNRTEYFQNSSPLGFTQNEHHLEVSANLYLWDGQVLATVGYSLVRGEGPFKSDLFFVGLQTGISCALSFSKNPSRRFGCGNNQPN